MRTPSLTRARLVVPPLAGLGGFLFAFLALEALQLLAVWRLGARLPPLTRLTTFLLFTASVNHGIFRSTAFHPAFREGYRAWLATTPWTSRKPLPLGPIELVWEDGLVLGPLMLLSLTQPVPRPLSLLCTFLLTYLLALTLGSWLTRDVVYGYATAFALGVPVWLWYQSRACLAALAGTYLIARAGLGRTLARFPWEQRKLLHPGGRIELFVPAREACGWPHDRMMAEVVDDRRIRRTDAILSTMLASWWFYATVSLITEPGAREMISIFGFVLAISIAPVARLMVYTQGYRSPQGPWARIMTFRWIIPRYDQVFVAPACSVLAGLATLVLLRACAVPSPARFTAAAGLTILAALVTPPRLRRWRLTGLHRMVPTQLQGGTQAAPFVQVT
jgi:hypothetical protein